MRTVNCHGRKVLSGTFTRSVIFDVVRICDSMMIANSWTWFRSSPLRHINDQSFVDGLPTRIVLVERATDVLFWTKYALGLVTLIVG